MRLISQHGNVDISYENVSLVHKDNEIVAVTSHGTPNGVYEVTMGKYSTKEKAYKVMEMVRNEYLNYATLRNVLNSVEQICVIPRVFIFPKDEDVEV